MKFGVADLLKVERDRVEVDFAGLNHMVYGLKAKLDGVDVTEEVVERLAESSMTMQNIKDLPFNADFIRALGIIPCPYHKYYYKTKDMLESELEEFKEGKVRGQVVEALEADLYKDETLDVKPPQLEQRGGAYYSDAACNLISSIYNDKHDIQVVNTRNNGTIKNFKDNNAIEVSCVITKNGARPMSVGYLPEGISGLVSQIKDFEVLAARAAVNSSYRDALKALCINPLIPSDDLAKVILDEMLEAHKEHLGDFK